MKMEMEHGTVVAERMARASETEPNKRQQEDADREELLRSAEQTRRWKGPSIRAATMKMTGSTASWARVRAASAAKAMKAS